MESYRHLAAGVKGNCLMCKYGPGLSPHRPRQRLAGGFSCAYPVELVHGRCHRFLLAFRFYGSELAYDRWTGGPPLKVDVPALPAYLCRRLLEHFRV